jgi:bifunctional UDP-N-acetylglucosamine pyrophosphorylase/glucosamine-1-phosphate N-acetyltransferase
VRIGNAVEIKNSIIMEKTNIGHLSYLGDSVIGHGCNFGAGTKVANLRHDGRNVRVATEGGSIDTGRRKLGVIMGDGVHTGINTSINVGVMMAARRSTRPGEVVMR